MKKFALAKSANLVVPISDIDSELGQVQSIQSDVEDAVLNLAINDQEAASMSTCTRMDISEDCTLQKFFV